MSEHDLTRNQALVFDALRAADQPLSAYTILDKLRDAGFRAPLQVYRALEKLIEKGLVHRLESINSFVACAHPHDNCASHGLTAFAICERCSQVIEFHDHGIEHRLADWAKERGFKPSKTLIEVKGICAACAA